MSFFEKKSPADSFHIYVEWLESCSSLAENGVLGKGGNIGEFKKFCTNIALPVRGSVLRLQCFLSLVTFSLLFQCFGEDVWRLVKSINVLV